jgi:hypothetical protein
MSGPPKTRNSTSPGPRATSDGRLSPLYCLPHASPVDELLPTYRALVVKDRAFET